MQLSFYPCAPKGCSPVTFWNQFSSIGCFLPNTESTTCVHTWNVVNTIIQRRYARYAELFFRLVRQLKYRRSTTATPTPRAPRVNQACHRHFRRYVLPI